MSDIVIFVGWSLALRAFLAQMRNFHLIHICMFLHRITRVVDSFR